MPQQTNRTRIPTAFQNRRQSDNGSGEAHERRQFRDGNRSDRPEVAELADAVDEYKQRNCRRFITFEALFDVIQGLGYHK